MSRQYDSPIVDIARYVFHYVVTDETALEFARMAFMDSMGCAIETLMKSDECRRLLGPIEPVGPNGFRLPWHGLCSGSRPEVHSTWGY